MNRKRRVTLPRTQVESHEYRPYRRKRNKPLPRLSDADWLRGVELLIAECTTPARTHGRYKGHGSTDMYWVWKLFKTCHAYIKYHSRGRMYDGNMAVAALMGRVLVLWFCNIQRAKGFDPNRPLTRRAVFTKLTKYRGELVAAMSDDRLMGAVWGKGQAWNFPFGRGAKGGKFV